MHREANTSDKDIIRIRNHFNNSDFTNTSSEVDVDMNMTYSDFASVNKSSGMILESSSHFYTELNLGEFIDNNGGRNDTISTIMKVNLTRHLWLVETENFDFLKINQNVFVKLKVSKASTFSLNETETFPYNATNSSEIPTNFSEPMQQHNSTNSSITSLKRVRRANDEDNKIIPEIWAKTEPLYLDEEKTFVLFVTDVLGFKVKGSVLFSVKSGSEGLKEVGVTFKLSIGGNNLPAVLSIKYSRSQLQGNPLSCGHQWQIKTCVIVPVHVLRLGVNFTLKVKVNIKLSFPPSENSLNPVKLTVQIEPFSEVTASIEGYISVLAFRAGAYGEGKLVRVGLPVTLSYCDKRWCITLCLSLKALELNAGIFYQWWNVWKWDWGERRTIHDFGKWTALQTNSKLFNTCTAPPTPKTDPSPYPDPDPKPTSTSTTATSTTSSISPSMVSSNSSVTRTVLTTTVTVCTPFPSCIFTIAERPKATISSLTNASSAPTAGTVVQVTRMDTAKASVTNTPSTVSVITAITSTVASETIRTSSTKTLDIGSTKSASATATSSTKTTAILTVKGTATTPSTVLTAATIGSTATEISIAPAPTTAYRSENMPSIVSDSLATTISSEASSVIKATTSGESDASSSERTFTLSTSATATTSTQ